MAQGTLSASTSRAAATDVEPGHGRRFGEMLIEEALITREQLQEALRIQRSLRNYLPLGQILLNHGWVTRKQLTTLLRRHRKSARLGELLVSGGRITQEQLDKALRYQAELRRPLGHALRALGYVGEETIREGLCAQLHINFFDLDRIDIDPALAKVITEKYAVKRRVVPLFRIDGVLVIAVDDPTDVGMIEELQQFLRMRVEIVTSTVAKLGRALKRLYAKGSQSLPDPTRYENVLIGLARDQEVVDLAAKALRVRILPPAWQSH